MNLDLLFPTRLFDRQRDDKCRPLSRPAFCRDASAVALDNLAANGKADACPLVFALTVQALEGGENAVEILFVKTDPVILHKNLITLPSFRTVKAFGGDLDERWRLWTMEFQGIANQVLQ